MLAKANRAPLTLGHPSCASKGAAALRAADAGGVYSRPLRPRKSWLARATGQRALLRVSAHPLTSDPTKQFETPDMLRFLARALGLILIAAGFVGIVIDGTRSIANGTVMFTPLGEMAFRVLGERYLLLQPAIERHVHPLLWDPVVLNLTLLPGSVVAFLLGVLLLWLGQKRAEPIGFATG